MSSFKTNGRVKEEFEVNPASSSESEPSASSDEEEEVVEVKHNGQTLYFHSRDRMAQCEFCGGYGVKDTFLENKFCTSSCAEKYSKATEEGTKTPKQKGETPITISTITKQKRPKPKKARGFDWSEFLQANDNIKCAPVKCFQHVPLADSWDVMTVGMKLEVINYESRIPTTVYWMASVVQYSGYMAQLRYEGFDDDSSKDFWVNLTTYEIHPVGWCASNDKPLVPPREIREKFEDWKDYLVSRLTGSTTLPHNFNSSLKAQIGDCQLKRGMQVEVMDKMCLSAMRVATVQQVIGSRVKLRYISSGYEDDLFFCDYCSPLVHPVGWSALVGHNLNATSEYQNSSGKKIKLNQYEPNDSTPAMFPAVPEVPVINGLKFQVGMKLEAIDPLNLSAICVATVMKVLKNNYLMIGMDGSEATDGSDWFCYHASSPCIFPAGFCSENGLTLSKPRDYVGKFSWPEYLSKLSAQAAPKKLFTRLPFEHGFGVGMKLEAADLMDPRLLCVATVDKCLGRLLRIHFDGWDDSYDQWVDCQSPDIYPVGWCAMTGYSLERPKTDDVDEEVVQTTSKKTKKN